MLFRVKAHKWLIAFHVDFNNSIFNKMQLLVHKHLRKVPLFSWNPACVCSKLASITMCKIDRAHRTFQMNLEDIDLMATETLSWQAWSEMASHALFGTSSKRCEITGNWGHLSQMKTHQTKATEIIFHYLATTCGLIDMKSAKTHFVWLLNLYLFLLIS